jgi:hypothetical protein
MSIYYAKSTGGFYDTGIHKNIPSDAIEITKEKRRDLLEAQSIGAKIVSDESGNPILEYQSSERVIICDAYQFYRALSLSGLRAEVESALVASNNQELIDAFVKATSFTQNHPKVLQLAKALGKTDKQIKELFELALTIEL